MMDLRYMIVLTSVSSMIGLALPSDDGSSVLTQRKIAKGAKKNAPPLSQREAIPVDLLAPLAMRMPELEAAVTEAVLNILEEPQEPDNERRNLQSNGSDESALGAVQITGTTKTKCPEQYLTEVVACYAATITIGSKEALVERIQKLQAALKVVISIDNGSIAVTQQRRGGYPYVKLKNTTPYAVAPATWKPTIEYGIFFCPVDFNYEGIAPGGTWSTKSRGICTVREISAFLTLPDPVDGLVCDSFMSQVGKGCQLKCTTYFSGWGTSYSMFSIIMGGVDGCCVKSSHEDQVCSLIRD